MDLSVCVHVQVTYRLCSGPQVDSGWARTDTTAEMGVLRSAFPDKLHERRLAIDTEEVLCIKKVHCK